MQRDGRRRSVLVVRSNQRTEVQVGEEVPVQDQEPVAEPHLLVREPNGARGAEWLGLLDVTDRRPLALHVVEHLAQRRGPEPAAHHHLADPVPGDPVDQVADERPIDQGERGLRPGERQGTQPRSLPAHEDEGLHQSRGVCSSRPVTLAAAPPFGRPIPS